MRVPRVVGFALAWCFLLLPSAVHAQVISGTIAGVVRDTSGGVLPGITVEAASPVLIEKTRTVVTDSRGLYRIVDLRPGVYTVTFSLSGFSTFRRDGVEVTTGFTATVNGEMTVGAIEETITVSGAAPLVDAQNTRSQSTISRDTMDALPTTGRVAQLVSLIPGANQGSASNHDVGGVGSDRGQIAVHGQNLEDMNINLGGMDQRVRSGGSLAINVHLFQEVTMETGGFSAQAESGGIQVNVVTKDGGNRFSGTFSSVLTGPNLESDNFSEALRARGLTTKGPGLRHLYDNGLGVGGPILRNRLWFFAAARHLDKSQYQQGNYFNKLQDGPSVSTDPTWRVVLYEPDLSQPAFSRDYSRDVTVSFTGQAGKHRINFSHSQQPACQCAFGLLESGVGGAILVAPEASGQHHYNPQYMPILRYTYPVTSRLLVEGGASMNMYGGNSKRQQYGVDGNERVSGDVIAITDTGKNLRYGSRATNLGNLGGSYTRLPIKIFQQRFSVSYITGSHSFKVGVDTAQFKTGTLDSVNDANQINGARDYTFRNGTPTNVRIWASPFAFEENARDIAAFVQDQWTIRRLTVNGGVRWNNFNGSAAAVSLPAGPWVPAREYPGAENAPNWTNLNPRGGVAYDLFGNGRTAVKASLGRFSSRLRHSVAGPARSQIHNTSRNWTDTNKNYVPDCDLLNPAAQDNRAAGGDVCGRWNNLLFGQRSPITTRYADDALEGFNKQSSNWQGSVSAQHELRPGLGLNVGYYRTWFGGFQVTDNLAVTPTDFDQYCITVPVDSRLPNSGQQLCGFYDLKPQKFGQQDNLVTQASHYGKQTQVYNGVDVTMQARFGRGGQVGGGLSVGRTVADNCLVVDSPQDAQEGFCKVTPPWSAGTQVKFMVVYPLPWDLQTSAIYQNYALDPVRANLVVSNADIVGSLGRDLGSCRGAATCNANVTLPLIPTGSMLEGRLQQVDLRFSKVVPVRGVRLKGSFDIYNLFNSGSILAQSANYGSGWRQPLQVMGGRLLKFTISGDF